MSQQRVLARLRFAGAAPAVRGALCTLALTGVWLTGCFDGSRDPIEVRIEPLAAAGQGGAYEVASLGASLPSPSASWATDLDVVAPASAAPASVASEAVGSGPSGRATAAAEHGAAGPREALFRGSVSPWGVAPSAALSYSPADWIDEMTAAGVTAVRGFHPGRDGELRGALPDSGVDLTGILQWTPPGEPEATLPVSDLAGWKAYVADQVVRHRHAVSRWEVWNEPPNFTADGAPESYAAVVAAAYDVAKAIDPAVEVGIAAKSVHLHYLAAAMDAGAAGHFDFVTLHPYEAAAYLEHGAEGPFLRIAGNVRAMLAQKSPDRAHVPIHFTEIGLEVDDGANRGTTPELQADGLVMIYTLALAQGIERVHWFDPRDSETLEHGLLDGSGAERPAYRAYRALTTWLGERPAYHGRVWPEDGLHGHVFSGPHGTVLSAWAERGAAARPVFDSDVRVVDPHDGRVDVTRSVDLDRKPVLIVAAPGSPAEAQIHEDVGVAGLPGREEHDTPEEARMEAGRRSRGVVLLGDRAIVNRDGVAEVDASHGGPALLFAVDADFAGWTPEPIEVTAVVRGHGTGNPGFNLKYEAARRPAETDGYNMVGASEGWRTVSGTEPTAFTWTLDDARFIGKYGANLRLDSDSRAHADWSLLRLSVRRLDGPDEGPDDGPDNAR